MHAQTRKVVFSNYLLRILNIEVIDQRGDQLRVDGVGRVLSACRCVAVNQGRIMFDAVVPVQVVQVYGPNMTHREHADDSEETSENEG